MEVNKKTYAGYLKVKFSELWKIFTMDLSQNSSNNLEHKHSTEDANYVLVHYTLINF